MTDVYSEVKVVYDRRGGPDKAVPTTTTGVNTFDVAPIGPEQTFLDQASAYAAANRGTGVLDPRRKSEVLEDQLRNTDARELFHRLCAQESTKVKKINTQLLAAIPAETVANEVYALTTEGTYGGGKQLKPFLALFSMCHHVTRLELVDQYLSPASVSDIAERCSIHPGVTSIDLSHNFIEYPEAKLLLRMLKRNKNILHLHLTHTAITPAIMSEIEKILRTNATVY